MSGDGDEIVVAVEASGGDVEPPVLDGVALDLEVGEETVCLGSLFELQVEGERRVPAPLVITHPQGQGCHEVADEGHGEDIHRPLILEAEPVILDRGTLRVPGLPITEVVGHEPELSIDRKHLRALVSGGDKVRRRPDRGARLPRKGTHDGEGVDAGDPASVLFLLLERQLVVTVAPTNLDLLHHDPRRSDLCLDDERQTYLDRVVLIQVSMQLRGMGLDGVEQHRDEVAAVRDRPDAPLSEQMGIVVAASLRIDPDPDGFIKGKHDTHLYG